MMDLRFKCFRKWAQIFESREQGEVQDKARTVEDLVDIV
jgi:hypothetical protein